MKRQLRDAFDACATGLLPDHDYVLVVRPGLAEAAEANGFDWLVDRVREVVAADARRSDEAPERREEARTPCRYLAIGLVRLYRSTLGLLFAGRCKYHPSCSQYAIDALQEFGLAARRSRSAIGASCAATRGATAESTTSHDQRLFRGRARVRPKPVLSALRMIVLGLLGPIESVLTDILEWLHSSIGLSWAWAIVVLTVGVRIVILPLTIKQIRSMQRLQQYAPRAQGAAAEVQGRQAAHERRGHEVLPGAQGEPGRLVPPDPAADPDLHLALLRAPRLREGGLPALPVVELGFLNDLVPDITEHVNEHWSGWLLLVIYVGSQLLVAPALDDRVQSKSQRYVLLVLPVRLHPVHHQLPGRSDDLLGDDEPLDGGPGPRHATALSRDPLLEMPKKSSRTPAKRAEPRDDAAREGQARPRRRPRTKTPPATPDGPAQPRPVRRRKKKGPRTRR